MSVRHEILDAAPPPARPSLPVPELLMGGGLILFLSVNLLLVNWPPFWLVSPRMVADTTPPDWLFTTYPIAEACSGTGLLRSWWRSDPNPWWTRALMFLSVLAVLAYLVDQLVVMYFLYLR